MRGNTNTFIISEVIKQVQELQAKNEKLRAAMSDLLASYKMYVKKADESEYVINAEEAMKITKS